MRGSPCAPKQMQLFPQLLEPLRHFNQLECEFQAGQAKRNFPTGLNNEYQRVSLNFTERMSRILGRCEIFTESS